MNINCFCLGNLSSELSLLSFMKIGTTPAYKNRRLFVQKIKDREKAYHEYYISTGKVTKVFSVDMNIY